jgi:hypothetical protein
MVVVLSKALRDFLKFVRIPVAKYISIILDVYMIVRDEDILVKQ